jgi:hypothetical protein
VAQRRRLSAAPYRGVICPMPDFPLLLDAPDRHWAQHVESLIQKALGERGSVTLGLPGERLPSAPRGSALRRDGDGGLRRARGGDAGDDQRRAG